MLLNKRVKLFKNIDLVTVSGEVLNKFNRKRIYTAEFKIRNAVAQCLFCILITNTGRDNTDFLIVIFNGIYRGGFSPFALCNHSVLYNNMSFLCHGRHHNIFTRIFNIFLNAYIVSFTDINYAS